MNIKLSLISCAAFAIFLSCSNGNDKKEESIKNTDIDSITILDLEETNRTIESPTDSEPAYNNSIIKLIDSKQEIRELDGNFNQMTLFEVDKGINLDQLKEYCSTVKPNYSNGYFQILVFFKQPGSARFPNNPLTGLFMEESDLKNIKAVYKINNINGYSKLDYYEKNEWESLAQTININ
ncbi:hypothetical protein [Chryseobacterium sp. MMS23-Vi53]|uniref:hypothetical protein n=1 Tax=Chryseobacterium sp. MMS23-Vi53 TaxID=3386644 RepID=UPI0039ECC9B9